MRISYLVKFLLLLLGLVLLLETASYITTRIVIREAVTQNARNELLRGGEVFAQLMQARAEQLALSVNVLSDDFGFRAAVASDDALTINSALINHSARIEADLSMVFDVQGKLVTVHPPAALTGSQALSDLQTEAMSSGLAYTSLVIDNKPYQFVLSAVRAPLLVGMAGMGFEIEENLTLSLKRLTGLEVSFVSRQGSAINYLSGTLDSQSQQTLLKNLEHHGWQADQVWESEEMMNLLVAIAREQDNLAVVLQVPLEQVLTPFASLDTQLFWLALGFSLCAALLAFVLARSVTQPVRTLADTARLIGAGDYAQPLAINSRDELGELAKAFVKMQSAIGEREQQILFQAEHDPLTGLPNRSRVLPELETAVRRAQAQAQVLVLLVIDVRNFTQINDELTPEIGDQVLHRIARRILLLAAPDDKLLRLGSDEFLLLMAAGNTSEGLQRAEAIHQLFIARLVLGDLNIKLELNIGLASFPEDGNTPEVLLRRANLALNQGRQQRQQTCVYEAGWDEHHLRRLQLLREFKPALASGNISLHYQPKIDLGAPRRLSAEALVRWQHPQLGFVNPEEFIAVIESGGQVHLLTRWLVRTVIEFLAQRQAENCELQVSVNLSALDLLVDDFPEYLGDLLKTHLVSPGWLCLEITESAFMREAEKSLRNLHRLRDMGLSLSIDDYGTGYSSLSQLRQLPVAELKIDKSFILNLEQSQGDQRIVRSTIELGHTLGLSVTAEGVETAGARDLLRSFNCDKLQGYFYSRPLPAPAFIAWMSAYLENLTDE